MGTLINLHELGQKLQDEFESVFLPDDVELPDSFKSSVNELGGYKYDYQRFLVHIYSEDLNGYIPNQWFIIASFFVDYYIELQKYKNLLVETLKSCGLSKSDERKALMSMYSTELASKPKDKAFDVHKADTIVKVKQEITNVLNKTTSLSEEDKDFLILFVSNYDWWYGGKTIDRGDFYVSPILALAKVVNASHSYIAEICKSFADSRTISDNLRDGYKLVHKELCKDNSNKTNFTLQQIYYGAPGTGKSHEINRLTEGKDVTRTTFHPDTDYSTFVGCYKPHMEEVDMTIVIGETLKVVKDEKGEVKKEKRIVYKYSCQAFLQAYIAAWQHPEKEHYLIIEEINRGNCAQIFGDIFQLLDRNWSGYSCYPIKADTDMEQELKSLFAKDWNMGEELSMKIDNMYAKHYPKGIIKEIKDGSLLLLPQNLFIWATMNTSDQSLFPIDSAFKRRWDWKYVKIAKGRSKETKEEYNWQVKFDYMDNQTLYHCSFQWWDFLNTINEQIAQTTSSDDKKLGYFFCKPKEQGGELIDAETFVGKVVFYLWNDVYKDESSELFKVAEGKEPSFDLFYNEKEEDGEWKVVVDTNCLKSFVDNVFKKQPDKVIVEADHQETEEKQESSVE
jgi:hypothetical protein